MTRFSLLLMMILAVSCNVELVDHEKPNILLILADDVGREVLRKGL